MIQSIHIPESLTPESLLPFSVKLRDSPKEKNYVLNFRNVGHVEPFGMLFLAALIRQFVKARKNEQGKECRISVENYQDKSYPSFMGLFKSFGLNHGNAPGEACGSGTYIPLTRLPISRITREARDAFVHQAQIIDNEALKIARVLSRSEHGDLTDTLTYSIRELMRNVVEHGQTTHIWYAAQYWPSKNRVEVAILDEGVGLLATLKNNPKLNVESTEIALALALQPGVSGIAKSNRKIEGDWVNSGYGLYMTSSLCKSGGDFLICNDTHALSLCAEETTSHMCSYEGLAIRMVLDTSRIKDLNAALSEFRKAAIKK